MFTLIIIIIMGGTAVSAGADINYPIAGFRTMELCNAAGDEAVRQIQWVNGEHPRKAEVHYVCFKINP